MSSSVAQTVSTELTLSDRFGGFRMRLDLGRDAYSVGPGLYRVGTPTPASPVLLTANYKLTFDHVRSQLAGLDAWLLVVDTNGINVWCAAGKGTFGTVAVAKAIVDARLADTVEHRTVIIPQLGATGVAAHDVRAFTGFRVVFGPVRAADIREFLDSGMEATQQMRTVTFDLPSRLVLTGVELSAAWNPKKLAWLALVVLVSGIGAWGFSAGALLARGGTAVLAAYAGLLAGGLVMPALLPWLPSRAFAAKGALAGVVAAVGVVWLVLPSVGALASGAAALATVAIASYAAMNFTGATPITSLSGVQAEMRAALPWQIVGAVLAAVLWVASAFLGKGW